MVTYVYTVSDMLCDLQFGEKQEEKNEKQEEKKEKEEEKKQRLGRDDRIRESRKREGYEDEEVGGQVQTVQTTARAVQRTTTQTAQSNKN